VPKFSVAWIAKLAGRGRGQGVLQILKEQELRRAELAILESHQTYM